MIKAHAARSVSILNTFRRSLFFKKKTGATYRSLSAFWAILANTKDNICSEYRSVAVIYVPYFESMAARDPIEKPLRARACACIQVDMLTRFVLVAVNGIRWSTSTCCTSFDLTVVLPGQFALFLKQFPLCSRFLSSSAM